MKIGDRIFVRGYIDEIRKDTVIVRNDGGYFGTILSEVTGELPSAQPEYYDYSDIDYVWNYYAEEQDINLTDGAKQLKDAMWVGYRKGKQAVQPEIIRCKDCKYITEHYDTDGNTPYWTCSEWDSGTDYDGFCHYAERRTDDSISD